MLEIARLDVLCNGSALMSPRPLGVPHLVPAPGARDDETPTNLTATLSSLTSLVGRDDALAHIDRRFDEGARLVTVLGGPGLGKTRVASSWAEAQLRHFRGSAEGGTRGRKFPGGVFFCDLTEARDEAAFGVVVARTLGVHLPGTSAATMISALAERLSSREPTLVVLDNFEQLVDSATEAVATLLARARELRLLVTSRERLRAAFESVLELPPLTDENAAALFRARARAAGGDDPNGNPSDDASVAALVRELDGIPLAIELAAARSRVMTPREILARLARRFDVLTDGLPRETRVAREVRDRHATMRGAIDWSWTNLSSLEQSALAQCAVFAGGFTLEAGEHVLSLGEGVDVISTISALRDKSLLLARATSSDSTRFSLFVSVREYAEERLRESGTEVETRRRHARWYVELSRDWAVSCRSVGDPAAQAALLQEKDNLLAAHRYAVATHDAVLIAETALTLEPSLVAQGPFDELVAVLERAHATIPFVRNVDRALAAYVAFAHANTQGTRGQVRESVVALEALLVEASEIGDRHLVGEVLVMLGTRRRQLGLYQDAWRTHEEAQVILQGTATRPEALNLASIGRLHGDFGRFEAARAFDERARALSQQLGDRLIEGMALGNLAQLDQELGNLDAAEVSFTAALAAFRSAGDLRYAAIYLGHVGDLARERGDHEAAAATYRAAVDELDRVRIPRGEGLFRAAYGGVLAARGELEAARDELARATRLLETVSDPHYLTVLELHRQTLALAARGPRAEIEAKLAAALSEKPPTDVRFAARMLGRALANTPDSLSIRSSRHLSHTGSHLSSRLVIADRRFLCERGDQRHELDLERRGPMRRLLLALVERRRRTPGQSLDAAALLAAGWPGERVHPEAGGKRVRVAIASLRRMGLEGILLTRDDGYSIDPKCELVHEADATDEP